jgi:alpha-L-arabinofuranosidase
MIKMKSLLRHGTMFAIAMTSACCVRADEAVIRVQADQPIHRITRYLTGTCIEDVNHEIYGGIYSQMIFGESFQEAAPKSPAPAVSGMWRIMRRGAVEGVCSLETHEPFAGQQSQRVTFLSGQGEWGIENQGLNRWGMALVGNRPYEGYVWVRTEKPTELWVALESRDGATVYAEQPLEAVGNQWQRLDFFLTPSAADPAARLAIKLKQPGSVVVGQAFLEPGEWGRFKGLPVRKDVVNGLIDQGITVLRYGGSMVNHDEYRWKKMTGPRDRRPPYHGTWYAHSSNGWGIPDFLALCDAAGFLGIPDFNINETAQDMVDFVEYANGPADSEWGRRRAADGHPQPYALKYLELGNEERVNDVYANKFEALAKAIWAKDPEIILVVGDFSYHRRIQDPQHFSGADSGITNLSAHERILKLAREHQREVWFDVHVWTEGPRPDSSWDGALSFCDALDKIANGAAHQVVVFELNANQHSQQRALANALAINAAERDGRMPIVTSANCLQPDGQNDNGWDQGLLFLNPSAVWLQPPGYVTRMISHNYQPLAVRSEVESPGQCLDVSAKRSDDGQTLVLQIVNVGEKTLPVKLHIDGFAPSRSLARVEELAAPLNSRNTAQKPEQCQTAFKYWKHELQNGETVYPCPPFSFTVIRFE